MPGKVITVQDWPGLRLDVDPAAGGLGIARDATNVYWTKDGLLRRRSGIRPQGGATEVSITGNPSFATWRDGASDWVLSVDNGILKAYASDSSTVSFSLAASGIASWTEFGTPTATRLYIAQPNTENPVQFTTAGGFTQPVPTGSSLEGTAIATWRDRVVVSGRLSNTAAGQNQSTVRFSDAGDPLTFSANNYVDLATGDGEGVQTLVAWRELLFAFKRSRFYVFHGVSTDSSGNPVFNYRPVDADVGVAGAPGFARAACATPDGVYFISNNGVYRTTGDAPELISGPVQRFFDPVMSVSTLTDGMLLDGASTSSYLYSASASTQIAYANGRLYLAGLTTSVPGIGYPLLVYDIRQDKWSLMVTGNLPTNNSVAILADSVICAYERGGTQYVGRYAPDEDTRIRDGHTTDGLLVRGSYRLGDVQAGGEASLRRIAVFPGDTSGGRCEIAVSVDGQPVDDTSTVTNLVTNPSFEVATTNWALGGTFCVPASSITRITTQQQSGNASGQVVVPATADAGVEHTITQTFSSGVAYTASIYVRSSTATDQVALVFGFSGGDVGIVSTVNLSTTWQRLSVTWTPSVTRATAILCLRHSPAVAATFQIDSAMVQQASAVSDYIDGDSASAKWNGVFHASTSTYNPNQPEITQASANTPAMWHVHAYRGRRFAPLLGWHTANHSSQEARRMELYLDDFVSPELDGALGQ